MEWTERYNGYKAQVRRIGPIIVAWESGNLSSTQSGFKVSFCGVRLKNRIENIEEAKKAGIGLARKVLREALEQIESG